MTTHTHRPPLRHGPVALAGWTRAVFDVWWFGHWVTRSGLIRAPDIAGHLGLATTFSRTLDGGAKRLCDLLSAEETIRGGSYLSPLCHLPLWATGRALTGSPLYRPLQVGQGAEFAIDWAVQARWKHLPTTNLTKLETLPTGPGALAPAACLPPEHKHIITSSTFQGISVIPSGFHLGWHSLPMQKSWTGSGRVRASQYMSWTSTPS